MQVFFLFLHLDLIQLVSTSQLISSLNITFGSLLFKGMFVLCSIVVNALFGQLLQHANSFTLKALNFNHQTQQLKLAFLSSCYITLFPFFQDWYLDWKIDNSIGIGLFVPKITFHSFCPNQTILKHIDILPMGKPSF